MKRIQDFTTILIVLLLITTFNQRSTINQLRNTINNQTHQISNLYSSVQGIHGAVHNSLTNLEMENRWLHSSSNRINAIADNGESMEVTVSWQFNELRKDEKVYLMVGEEIGPSQYKWEKIEVDTNGDLHFVKTLTLSLKNNYKLDTIAENAAGRRMAEVGRVDLYNSLKSRFHVHGNIHVMQEDKGHIFVDLFTEEFTHLYPEGQLPNNFISRLEIKSVFVEIYLDDQLAKNFDLLKETTEQNNAPRRSIYINKELEIKGLASKKLNAMVKITDDLGEIYEFPIL